MAKKLVCALGNPGKKYTKTRHNIGFRVLSTYLSNNSLESKEVKKLQAHIANHLTLKNHVICCFPQTFMNNSGLAFIKTCRYYNISLNNCLVLYDDIDLCFGKLRYREKGSAGTHNGMKSIIQETKCLDVARLRIGIGKRPFYISNLSEYVLSNFNETEESNLPSIISEAVFKIEEWLNKN